MPTPTSIRWLLAAIVCQSPVDAQSVLMTVTGLNPMPVGDLNGDGTRDVALFNSAGTSLVGVPSGTVIASLPTPGLVIDCGDVDGDGRDDIAFAETFDRFEIRSGISGTLLHSFQVAPGWENRDWIGFPGDVTGDGRSDFLVADPQATVGTMLAAGRLDLVDGATLAVVRSDFGTSPGQMLGAHWVVGDLDRDGRKDYVLPDLALQAVSARSVLTGQTLFVVPPVGTTAYDVGDIDADAFPDFTLVVYFKGWGIGGTVHSGANGAALFTYWRAFSGPTTGYGRVQPIGDSDGDGYDDLIVHGGPNWLTEILLSRTQTIISLPPNLLFRGSAGDVNGDGYPDGWFSNFNSSQILSLRPAGVTPLGSGCPDANGIVPRIGVGPGPRLGTQCWINLSDADPALPHAALGLGYSSQQWNGTPLPFSLGFVGLPACTWYASVSASPQLATSGVSGGRRHASYALQIANSPSLLGAIAYGQWLVFDVGSGGLTGSVTRAVRLQVVP
jgi:hypothetical protein